MPDLNANCVRFHGVRGRLLYAPRIISFVTALLSIIIPSFPGCRTVVLAWNVGTTSLLTTKKTSRTKFILGSTMASQEGNLLFSDSLSDVRLILASQSPRRAEILDMMGLKEQFIASPSPLDETKLQKELNTGVDKISPKKYVQVLSERKANAMAVDGGGIWKKGNGNEVKHVLIIGSDTIVDLNGNILEKPKDEGDARSMLRLLSNQWHSVHTGVAIYHISFDDLTPTLVSSFVETTRVKFSKLTAKDIDSYVKTKEPMDKAGSYGIQGIGGQLVEKIDGDYFTVMGLPMHRVSLELSKALKTTKLSLNETNK